MKAVIDDTTAIYVQDDPSSGSGPNNETQYRARFYVNPNSITMANGDILDLFNGRNAAGNVFGVWLRKNGSTYQISAGLVNDAGSWTTPTWYDISNNWTAVEIHYQAFSNSGSLTLWLDGVQKQSLTFIDNDTRTVTEARLGAQAIETGTNGTLYFDDFESRRFSYIGTLTDPGVDDPQATNQPGWFGRTYTYSATIPHAVTSVNPETGSADTYSYDANGNMTCRVENGVVYTHTYNAENRASSIAKRNTDCAGTIIESWSFAYDGDGVRVSTAHFTGTSGSPDSTTSYYMGGAYELKDGATKKYYSIAGMMVAVNDGTGLQYLLTDHLGSTVAVTNQSGTLTSQQRYLPFGAARTIPNSPLLGTDFTYTGQRKLDDGMGGIMDYKARFYSPYLNRFLQPDTIIPDQFNPQSWNRFSYVSNNPVRFNDPTGHMMEDEDDGGVASSGCVPGELVCQLERSERYELYKERQRQDQLIRLIKSGSGPNGSWTYEDKHDYFYNRNGIWGKPESWDPNGPRGWELFALHAGKLAANYSANQRDDFVRDFGLVFAGIPSRGGYLSASMSVKHGPSDLSFLAYSNDGLPSEYLDKNRNENQSHHYAGIFTLGYFTETNTASFVNWGRDYDNPGDVTLGNVAATDGQSFASASTMSQIIQLISSVIP